MWQNPHVLVIAEPINHLDRVALGALAEEIEQWNGAAVVICVLHPESGKRVRRASEVELTPDPVSVNPRDTQSTPMMI